MVDAQNFYEPVNTYGIKYLLYTSRIPENFENFSNLNLFKWTFESYGGEIFRLIWV